MAVFESAVNTMYALHTAVAEAVREEFSEFESFWAGECGEKSKNGLFCSENGGSDNRLVMPDGLLLQNNQLKVVFEIEEQKIASPVHLLGKWGAIAFSRCFIHERKGFHRIPFHPEATLVQICNSALAMAQSRTRKLEQWPVMEGLIRDVPRFGAIAHYHLLWGDVYDFGYHGEKRERLLDIVREALLG